MKSLFSIALLALSFNAVASDTPPSLDPKNCVFSYPKAALLNEEQGAVLVKVTVDHTGKVTSAELAKSSGSKTLDKATVSVMNTCKFTPAMKNGKAEAATTTINYEWSLSK